MDEERSGRSYETVRVPAELRDRIDDLFREYRGYDPAAFQESLSLVCDVAAGRLSPEDAPVDGDGEGLRTEPGDDHRPASPDAADRSPTPATAGERPRAVDEVFPRDWDADETVRSYLPSVVDAYVANPEGCADDERRAEAALATVASEAGVSPGDLRETLVERLYGGAGISPSLAEEFFAEALAAAAEVDDRPPTGVREAASDGGVASESGEFSVDSLLTEDDDDPSADCERCGTTTAVDDLDTVIGPEDGSTVRLLCRACSDAE